MKCPERLGKEHCDMLDFEFTRQNIVDGEEMAPEGSKELSDR